MRRMRTELFSVFATFTVIFWRFCIAVEVKIEQGSLRGSSQISRNGTKYYEFLSIPFAKPPIRELRFEPPQSPDSWPGIRDATKLPPACIQKDILTIFSDFANVTGQEDCLYLNVYSPEVKTQPLPVMVFIHGGGFITGSTSWYLPKYFMDHKIIMVTIQYRLNILGFLSTGDHVLPGNNGMKDQVAALKWVQKNIATFGGDPTKVTVFGESAGAASVHYHLHSPLSRGLFHRAISQSGTSLSMWAHTPHTLARQKAKTLGVLTYCPTTSSKALVDCLRKLPAEELVQAHHKFYVWDFDPLIPFSIVDEPADVEGTFMTKNSWHHEVDNVIPWIVGFNFAEGGLKASRFLKSNGTLAATLNKNYKRLFPISFFYGSWVENETKIAETTEKLKQFYFGDKDIGIDTAHELVQLYSDGYFTYDSLVAARRHKGTVYFYYFDHRNERTFNEVLGDFEEDLGVCHGDELINLFEMSGFFNDITKGDDFEVSERLIKYWVNFADNGSPSNNNDVWQPVASDDFEYLHITTKVDTMKKELLKDRYQFWNSLQLIPPLKAGRGIKITDEL